MVFVSCYHVFTCVAHSCHWFCSTRLVVSMGYCAQLRYSHAVLTHSYLHFVCSCFLSRCISWQHLCTTHPVSKGSVVRNRRVDIIRNVLPVSLVSFYGHMCLHQHGFSVHVCHSTRAVVSMGRCAQLSSSPFCLHAVSQPFGLH